MKKRALVVLLSVVVMLLVAIAPASAEESSPVVTVTIDMPGGSVHVIDTVFDVNVYMDEAGHKRLLITLANGVLIDGYPGFALAVIPSGGGGGDVCIPGEFGC
jgi:hypothetical protein